MRDFSEDGKSFTADGTIQSFTSTTENLFKSFIFDRELRTDVQTGSGRAHRSFRGHGYPASVSHKSGNPLSFDVKKVP